MKKLVLTIFILLSALSFSNEENTIEKSNSEYKFSLGFMTGYGSNLYHVEENDMSYIPFISLEKENIYISGTEMGYRYKLNPRLTLTGFSQLFGGTDLQGDGVSLGRTQLSNSDMEDGYKGISSRQTQVELGLRLGYNTNFHRVKLLGEVRGGERGAGAKISAVRPFMVTSRLFIIPQIKFSLLDENMMDYYFGVTEDEVNDSRNTALDEAYDPNKFGYASAMGISIRYYINSKISAFSVAEVQYVSDEIGDSPIVDNGVNYFTGVGLRYDF